MVRPSTWSRVNFAVPGNPRPRHPATWARVLEIHQGSWLPGMARLCGFSGFMLPEVHAGLAGLGLAWNARDRSVGEARARKARRIAPEQGMEGARRNRSKSRGCPKFEKLGG